MSWFFSKDWAGSPFVLFGPHHLAAIFILLLAILALALYGERLSERQRTLIRWGLASLLIIDEAGWHYWNWVTGQWTIQTMLPLHLCSVFVFLCAYMLVTKNYAIYEFAYFLGIGGALQAFLTPDAGIYGFPHFRFFQVLVSHGAIILAAVYMTTAEHLRPTWKSMKRVMVGANIYMMFVGMVNFLIGSNYLFIAHKPETASLMDVLPPWPWYILGLEIIGLLTMLVLYTPFAIKDLRKPASALSPSVDRL